MIGATNKEKRPKNKKNSGAIKYRTLYYEMKNPLEGFKCKCRFELAEKRIVEFEDGKMDIIMSKEQEGQRLKISEQSSRDLFDTISRPTHMWEVRGEERNGQRKYLNK